MSNEADPAHMILALEEQEQRLVFKRFSYQDAWQLGCLLVDMARKRNAPLVIDIRYGAQQVFHAALPGSSADNDGWVERKRRVVERYGHSSYLVGTGFRSRGTTFEESSRLGAPDYAAHGGSFPIRVADAATGVIGTVTVSGLPQEDDHALVVEALERFLAQPAPAWDPRRNGRRADPIAADGAGASGFTQVAGYYLIYGRDRQERVPARL